MNVWIVELSEPLPFEHGGRTMRCGQLAQRLLLDRHRVVWWSSNFSHIHKRFRCGGDERIQVAAGYEIELLKGPGYAKNVSLARIRSQVTRAEGFRWRATLRPPPDVILSAMPTLELSEAVVEYGARVRVPVVVDLRDKWPDAFLSVFPSVARVPARIALFREFRRIRRICRGASSLFAVSDEYLKWGLSYAGRPRMASDEVFLLGYDPNLAEPSPDDAAFLERHGILPEHFVVCFIGAFGATYDLTTVLHAARQAQQMNEGRIRFVLAGDGPRTQEWKTLARQLPNVSFPGWLSNTQITALLRRANAGLAAYAAGAPQSLPNKPFEYFAGGLPVISSLPGELKQLLADRQVGFTYRAGDATQLLHFIRRLASEPGEARGMGQRARRLAETDYSSTHIIDRMAAKLEGIAAGARSRTANSRISA